MSINDIVKPVSDHISEFNKFFKGTLQSDVSLLNIILKYVTQKRGKQIRPALVFLTAEICGGVSKRSYIGAALVELLHTATLIHDDVVDQAKERRGLVSINAEWNNKIAVLIGDFLLSKGLLTAVDNNEFMLLKCASKAIRRMSEGELHSIEKSRSLAVDEEAYFRITADKTASLLSSCCEIGAVSASDKTEDHAAFALYGEMIGMAFQIRDDIFDYVSNSIAIGKPVGNDLKEKKITLPLIYALNQTDKKTSKDIIKLIKSGKLTKKDISYIIDFTVNNGGIEYADQKAREFALKAMAVLEPYPDSPAKASLIELTDFVITRSL